MALGPRERWRQQVVTKLIAQAERCRAKGQLEAALACALEGFDLDPLAEALAVQAMGLLRDLGRRLEGVAVYERLKEAMGRELGLRPSARASALHLELIRG